MPKQPIKIVRLVEPTNEYSKGVVEDLEDLLARAKKGEFVAMAFAGVTKDGGTFSSFTACPNIGTFLGAVSHLQYRMNSKKMESPNA